MSLTVWYNIHGYCHCKQMTLGFCYCISTLRVFELGDSEQKGLNSYQDHLLGITSACVTSIRVLTCKPADILLVARIIYWDSRPAVLVNCSLKKVQCSMRKHCLCDGNIIHLCMYPNWISVYGSCLF